VLVVELQTSSYKSAVLPLTRHDTGCQLAQLSATCKTSQLQFNKTAFYSKTQSACECVHLVAGSYFRSRKKDGGHAIRSAVGEHPMLHAHFTALCVIDAELLAMEFLTCTEADVVDLFCSCDLDPMTFIYKLDSYCVEIQWMCKYELPT